MHRLTVYLVALLVPICCLHGIAFSLDASDYVPYPTSGPAISARFEHTLGLKADGRSVLAVGSNDQGQSNVGDWENIVQVSAGWWHTVGLQEDGTVLAAGYNGEGQSNVGGWGNIVQVSAGWWHTVGLQEDGSVVAVGDNVDGKLNVDGWENIVQVSAGGTYTVGLQADGSVVAVGSTDYGQRDVGDWANIVQVSAGNTHTVGLQADGSVVAVGRNSDGQLNVGDWANIVQVSAGSSHTVGLQADGSVVAVGSNGDGQLNVGDWENIVQVSAGGTHTVGLKTDGSVVAVGSNGDGQLNVGGWFLEEPSTTTTTAPVVTTSTSTPQVTTTTTAPVVTTSTTTSMAATTTTVPVSYSITGHVTGDIVAGVSVKLTGAMSRTLTTDTDGYYQFSNIAGEGDYTITPEHEDYDFEPQNHVVQGLASDVSDMDFVSTRIRTTPCPSESIYGEDSEEVEVLRYVRDNVLQKTPEGMKLIKLYYLWSPVIVKVLEEDEDFKADIKEMIDGILQIIR